MKYTAITVGYSRTYNLRGEAGAVTPNIAVSAELDGSDFPPTSEIERLMDEITLRVHAHIDDELEREGQSPVFYRGELHRLYRWEQRQAYVILAGDCHPVGDLGDWEQLTVAMRPQTVEESARSWRHIDGWPCIGPYHDLAAAREWYDAQTWYRVYGLTLATTGRLYALRQVDQLLVLPDGLTLPACVRSLGGLACGADVPRTRQHQIEWANSLGDRNERWWHTTLALGDQDELDDYVAGWLAALPKDKDEGAYPLLI